MSAAAGIITQERRQEGTKACFNVSKKELFLRDRLETQTGSATGEKIFVPSFAFISQLQRHTNED